jgi:glycosyltransferase involved in cell wall biosynthesis
MKIAIVGTRGIPARYGGFETFAEQLATRLVEHGHEVVVYCRPQFVSSQDCIDSRIRRVILPTIPRKYFDTVVHSFLSILHVLSADVDVVLLCNVANSPLAWIPRLARKPTVLNVDGLDRKRKKWNAFGRGYLLLCEFLALFTPTHIVTDAEVIQRYYLQRYGKRSIMISYGAEVSSRGEEPEGFDFPKGRYILYVSRLEPENNPELVIRAYSRLKTDWPLVLVGGNPYDGNYLRFLKSIASPRVIFTGPIYSSGYWALQRNAGVYVYASEVGGTHPGLLEAMAARNCVLFLDTPENRETVAGAGVPFTASVEDLAEKMKYALTQGQPWREQLGSLAASRTQDCYSWDRVTAEYEELFSSILAGRRSGPAE